MDFHHHSKKPLVSVIIATYNHEKYISDAIEGALMQRTDFEYEILIGEDDSKDKTRAICIEYATKFPDKIRLFLNDRKNVIYINGKATGRWNLVNLISHSNGKYIALCEGDDYWIDPCKLQKQVGFFETNKSFAVCFTNAIKMIGNKPVDFYLSLPNKVTTLPELLMGNFIPTCTMMIRNEAHIFDDFKDCIHEVPFGDWFLSICHARFGPIGFLNEKTGVYRVHDCGMWSRMAQIDRTKANLRFLEYIKGPLGAELALHINQKIKREQFHMAREYFALKDYSQSLHYNILSLMENPFIKKRYWEYKRRLILLLTLLKSQYHKWSKGCSS